MPTEFVDELWGLDRLEDLLGASDYVVVTVPHTPETDNIISSAQFALMKPSAMLVHISRGGIVDQDALNTALLEGQIARAAIDVAKPEPLPDESLLWERDNLLITYHIAGGTQREAGLILDIMRENLDRFMRGQRPMLNEIDKKQGF